MMFLATALSSTVPLSIFMLTNRHTAKREQSERHEENSKILSKLAGAMKYFHSHNEKGTKVLTADGIVPRP